MKQHLLCILLLAFASAASAQSTAFTYQGHLMDGGASANGNYDIQFTLKNALTAGTTVGTPQAVSPVTAVNGIFTVTLDFGSTSFDGSDRWVELGVRPAGSVAAYTALAPRQRLTATPYALKALSATNLSGTVTAGNIAAGTITGAMIDSGTTITAGTITTAGNLNLPATGAAGTLGVINQNGIPLLHSFGPSNFFAGANAGNFTMTGGYNTASGAGVLTLNTTGSGNTASGAGALALNTTGGYNTASGIDSLHFNTTGSGNTASGAGSLLLNTAGYNNTASGTDSLYSNTTGIYNTATGGRALYSNTTGNNNIALGYLAGNLLTTGSNNIIIGHPGVAAEANTIRIGDGMTQTDTYLTGIIHGDGSGLTNVPASALTGSIPASQVASPPPGMVLIPAGTFLMGNSVAADTDITDAAPVSTTVSAFYMDVNEVTLSEWQAVELWATSVGDYYFTSVEDGQAANHPVQKVSWYNVVKWCNARSERAGRTPVYYTDDAQTTVYRAGDVNVTNAQVKWTANGYRLPTEAEWEKAARGGLAGKRFPWGDTISKKQANYYGNTAYAYDLGPNSYSSLGGGAGPSVARTTPVGSFAANGYGLNDMAGNVFEWCWDWYGTPYAGGTDPHGAGPGFYHVIRGGCWDAIGYSEVERCASRNYFGPGVAFNYIGFRTVLPAAP